MKTAQHSPEAVVLDTTYDTSALAFADKSHLVTEQTDSGALACPPLLTELLSQLQDSQGPSDQVSPT